MSKSNYTLFESAYYLSLKFTAYKELLELVFSNPEIEPLSPAFELLGDDLNTLINDLLKLASKV